MRISFARNKADKICETLRENCGRYLKRYTIINKAQTKMKVKLWGINHGFQEAFEKSFISDYFKESEMQTKWIIPQRNQSYQSSFVFWITLKKEN